MMIFLRGILWLMALLPLGVLYLFSDMVYLLVYYVFKYRKKVVFDNMKRAFPEKSQKERTEIAKKFYRFFCDIFVETIKKQHWSNEQMKRHIEFVGDQTALQDYVQRGQNVILMTSHYCNWEWFATYSIHRPENKYLLAQVYQQLKSPQSDRLILDLRNKFGVVNIEKKNLLRKMLELNRDCVPIIYGFLSDQSPAGRDPKQYGVQFLGNATPVLLGTEKVAQKFDYPVIYGRFSRVKRGFYRCEFVLLAENPQTTAKYEITKKFFQLLEEDIRKKPEFWLWTHKRWKFQSKIEKML